MLTTNQIKYYFYILKQNNMNTKTLNQHKQTICDLTNKLFEVEELEAKHISDMLFNYMNATRCINDADDDELIEKFVDNCNRADLNILIIENEFEEVFNPIEDEEKEERIPLENKEC